MTETTTTEMRTIDDVIAEADAATTTETPAPAIRPLLVDDFPIDYDEGSINIYLREGDVNAFLAITDHASDYDPEEIEVGEDDEPPAEIVGVDMLINDGETLELAKTCVKVLAAMGQRDHLAELISEAAQALADIR